MYQSLSSARAVYLEPGPLASSLLQLPVLGGDWWEGRVEQEKARDPKNTFVMVAALSIKRLPSERQSQN